MRFYGKLAYVRRKNVFRLDLLFENGCVLQLGTIRISYLFPVNISVPFCSSFVPCALYPVK